MDRSHSISFGNKLLVLGAAMLLALGMSATIRAQSTTNGAIEVIVGDPNGGAVPDAPVSVENEGTGQKLDSTTNDVGECSFNVLQPGVYTATVTVTNFATYVQSGITVEVGRESTVHVRLKIASGNVTVNVTGEPPQVNITDQAIAGNVGSADIGNLPTNGRRWSSFALLLPGVTPDPDGYQDLNFHGINGYANNSTVDGGDNNQFFFAEERGRTRIAYTLSLDSVTNFQVNTSDYSAQYGRSAGGVINTVTRSGTNQFHGDLFYYYKNNAIGAQNPFTNETESVGGVVTSVPIKPPFLRQQFGGSVGGPIWKNKLFFFFTYDSQLQNFPIVEVPTSPHFLDAITLPTGTMASPFPTCSAAYTMPTVPTPATETQANALYCRGITQAELNSALSFLASQTGQVARQGNQNIEFPKLNWHLNPNNILTLSYNRMRWGSPAGVQTNAIADYGISSIGNDYVHDDMYIARLDSTFSSNVTNEMIFQVGKDFEFEYSQTPAAGEPLTGPGGLPPQITISPSTNTAGGATNTGTLILGTPTFLNRPQYPLEYRYQGADTISIVRGTHLLRFGIDVNQVTDTDQNLATGEGSYSYSSNSYPMADFITDYTKWVNPSLMIPGCTTSTGASMPCYHSFSQAFGPLAFTFSAQDIGIFGQDTWKVSPRVTVNYGVRWDYEHLPAAQMPNPNLPQTQSFPSYRGDIGPRVGVAWDVFGDGKTSLRGGWGLYYGLISGGTIFDAIAFTDVAASQFSDTFTNTATPAAGEPTFPATFSVAPPAGPASIDFFDPHDRPPLISEADVALQHEFGNHFVVSLTYMLTQGRRLPTQVDQNLAYAPVNVTYAVSGGPFNGETFTLPVIAGPRPDSAFTSFVNEFTDLVRSNYNAGTIEVSRHLSKGLEFESSYTWSHALDNAQGDSGFPSAGLLDQFNPGLDYGNSAFDVRSHFVLSAVWSPEHFSRGSFAHALLDGWTIAPIVTLSSNYNYTAGVTGTVSTLPGGLKTGLNATTITGESGSNRFPLLPRGYFTLPPVQNVNLHIGRQFHFGEKMVFEADAECFNLFNKMIAISEGSTTNYSVALTNPPSAASFYTLTQTNLTSFGVPNAVADTVYDVRQFQFAGHFTF